MALIDVMRDTPPAYARCTHAACGAAIEWVRTIPRGRVMPVNTPLVVVARIPHLDGSEVVTIDGGASHFATCPAAAQFRRAGRS